MAVVDHDIEKMQMNSIEPSHDGSTNDRAIFSHDEKCFHNAAKPGHAATDQ
jgi:hypothetical protein